MCGHTSTRLLMLALAWLLQGAALAAPTTPESCFQLAKILHEHSLIEQSTSQLRGYALHAIAKATNANDNLVESQKADLRDLPDKVAAVVHDQLKWDNLLRMYAEIYRKTYSQDEVNALLNFYTTPEGRSVLSKQTALSRALLLQSNEPIAKTYKKLQETIDAQVAEILARHIRTAAPATAASAASR